MLVKRYPVLDCGNADETERCDNTPAYCGCNAQFEVECAGSGTLVDACKLVCFCGDVVPPVKAVSSDE
ncbi:hypothetical protein I317_07343 [Kwoniella heveanensis CBS 569]|nr:hypothetical protein I317_07343 [Kwoniella heveanensis CBS 569]